MTNVARTIVRTRALAVALVLTALAAPVGSADAFTLIEDPFEGDELTVGGTLKSFVFAMHGDVLDWGDLAFLGGSDDNPSAIGLLALRPIVEAQIGERWRFAVHYDMGGTLTTATPGDVSGGASALRLGTGMPPSRFLPLRWTPVDHNGFSWRQELDWAWVRGRFGPVDVTVGRQPITFARAFLWTPMDVLGAFSPTQIDTEFKPGVDALRLDFALGRSSSLSLVAVAGELESDHDAEATLEGSSFAARARFGFQKLELGGFAGYVREDLVVGVDGFFDLDVVSLHAEATVTWVPDEDRVAEDGDVFVRATAGLVWTIPKFRLIVEAHYNGAGEADPEDYLEVASSRRFASGELYTLGRYYLGAIASWDPHPLVSLTLSAMGNLRDPSVLLTPGLTYSVAQNVDLQLGAFIPLGAAIDRKRVPEAQQQDPSTIPLSDLASYLPKTRSEYGAYPYMYFLMLKVAM